MKLAFPAKSKNDKLWTVKVKNTKGFDLSFNTRKEARDYKKLLENSKRQIAAKIIHCEFSDGYMTETESA